MDVHNVTEQASAEKSRLLARQLPVLRKMLGLSQTEFAKQIGVSRATLSNIETGMRDMSRTIYLACIAVLFQDGQTRNYLRHLNVIGTEESP